MPGISVIAAVLCKDTSMTHTPSNRRCIAHVRRRGGGLLAVLTAVCVTTFAASAAPVMADSCPNADLRAQNSSTHLPECRAYELVTNPYKQGFAVDPQSFSDDGALAYFSTGNFADNPYGSVSGNEYVAMRAADGWRTTAHNPPGEAYAFILSQGAEALSSDLRSSVWVQKPYGSSFDQLGFYLRQSDGAFALLGPVPAPGALDAPHPIVALTSDALSHVVVSRDFDNGHQGNLYEYVGAGFGPPRMVSIDNTGDPIATEGARACANVISGDGRVIIFSAPSCDSNGAVTRLWARVAGAATVEVSASECARTSLDPGGVCNAPAHPSFADASVDGSRVFFTTTQQLVNGDTDATNDLYACDIPPGIPSPIGSVNPCTALSEVSGAATGANVESVVRASDDGSRVYFVARGVLADNLGANDTGASRADGARNLYLWEKSAAHPSGKTTFVAVLDADDVSGAGSGAQTTADGRYLILTTSTRLVDNGPAADNDDKATDVYRYDAESREWLRLSTDTTGVGGNAVIDARSVGSVKLNTRRRFTMTADADTVVFETAEALSPDDVDGGVDVYEWHDGHVSAISKGGGAGPWITASGTDIFFKAGTLLPAVDGDTVADYYDARIGGGFDVTQPPPCTGDRCQGPLPVTPGLPSPGGGTSAGPGGGSAAVPTLSVRGVTAAQRKKLAATGKVTLTITANTPAILRAIATATITDRPTDVGSARRVLTEAGTTTLALTLTKKARARLAAAGRLTIKIAVTSSKVALTHSVTLKLSKVKRQTVRRAAAEGTVMSGTGARS